jgi:hypothetical protein
MGGALTIDPTGICAVEPLQYALVQVSPGNGELVRTIPLHHAVGGITASHGRLSHSTLLACHVEVRVGNPGQQLSSRALWVCATDAWNASPA